MRVYIERERRKLNMRFSGSVEALLKKLRISPETVIVVRNSEIVTEDTKLCRDDDVRILSVISGG